MFTATIGLLSLLLATSSSAIEVEKAYVNSFVELKGMEYGMTQERIKFVQKIIKCESNYKSNVYGDKGKAYSYLQFWRGTFDKFKKEWGHTWLSYDNPEDHLELGIYAFSKGYDSHWTCSKIVRLQSPTM